MLNPQLDVNHLDIKETSINFQEILPQTETPNHQDTH